MSTTNCLSMACSAFLLCNVSVISFSNLCTTESMTTSQTRIHRSAIHAIEPPHRPSMRTTTHQRNALNFLLILILWRQWQVWKNRAWSVQYCQDQMPDMKHYRIGKTPKFKWCPRNEQIHIKFEQVICRVLHDEFFNSDGEIRLHK